MVLPPRPRPAPPAAADLGLFGPSSVSWRLHSDPLVGVAVLRSLLLQQLHPGAAATARGVEQLGLPGGVWVLLRRTTEQLTTTTFGTAGEALACAARTRAVDAVVSGTDPLSGRVHRADDPDLLAWGHVCRVASVLDVLGSGGVPVSAADADRYVAEQVRVAAMVGLEPDEVPGDAAELRSDLDRARPLLRATPSAREDAASVVSPPPPAHVVDDRPAWSEVAGLAFAALPAWARAAYALDELPGAAGLHEAATCMALRALRESLLGVPVSPGPAGPQR